VTAVNNPEMNPAGCFCSSNTNARHLPLVELSGSQLTQQTTRSILEHKTIKMTITLHPAIPSDIPALTSIGVATFEDDRHTIVKTLGGMPYDHEGGTIERFYSDFGNKKYVCIKAVASDGSIVGLAGFWCVGVDRADVYGAEWTQVFDQNMHDIVDWVSANPQPEQPEEPKNVTPENDSVERLKEIESISMIKMSKILNPPGARCLIFNGVSVSPGHQGRGIGAILMQWVCDAADRLGVYIWIHASEEIWQLGLKMGFTVVEELPVDLDEFAPRKPTSDEEHRMEKVKDGRWGVYTIRYMKREAKISSSGLIHK
jgi:GNAT superfamily N-acetyltransferase